MVAPSTRNTQARATAMKRIDTDYLIWALLTIPALQTAWKIWGAAAPVNYEHLSWRTAEASVYLFLVSLMATPLSLMLRGRYGSRFLVRKRRYVGVAALAYGILHTIFYFIHTATWEAILRELSWFNVWSGWLVLFLLLPPGWTSRDSSVKSLGTKWKWVQRLVYPAAFFTWFHWACQFRWQVLEEAVMFYAPLVLLTLWRLWYNFRLMRRRAPA